MLICNRLISKCIHTHTHFNKDYHSILTVIDVLSKYAWAVPLKSKSGSETANAITNIIRKSSRQPKNLQTDMGKEFYNADVQRLVNKHGINHYSMYSVMKASVVERFARWRITCGRCLEMVTASRVELQCSIASNDRHATRWRNDSLRDSQKTLGAQRYKDRGLGEIQNRRFGTWASTKRSLKKVTRQIGPSRC